MNDFTIIDLNYVSLYVHDYAQAVEFYSRVFGPPDSVDENGNIHGWRMGATWLSLFPASAGVDRVSNPRNTEFAIQLSDVRDVDALHAALMAAGAADCMAPRDTTMYEAMRFGCVDDPFGVRIDVYCRLTPG